MVEEISPIVFKKIDVSNFAKKGVKGFVLGTSVLFGKNRSYSEILSDLRKIKHLTQKDLSLITGLSIQCISDIESKNSGNPTLKSLIKYLDALGYEICFQRNKEDDDDA